MSASSLKGLIYSLSFHQSLLLSPFSSYQLLAAYPMSSTDVYFTGEECERMRSQTDVSSARQFQPRCFANKNGRLWKDCLDLTCRKVFFLLCFKKYIMVVITAEAVGFKQSPKIGWGRSLQNEIVPPPPLKQYHNRTTSTCCPKWTHSTSFASLWNENCFLSVCQYVI